ncbi:carbohydrate kinase family protein [Maribacter aestuarii]|uniref:carbohydrate kinase family protein n=1 Tax=Maribacter aestuarii TaxID=1130723 RepID=UPI00248B8C1A|nr:carbohydrate kinase [Maribacter aestuarii]
MKNIYCIGELLIDFVAEKQGKDLSKANEFSKKAGGAPANVACAISKLGGKGIFIGCVGDDPFGKFLLNVLEEAEVDISLVQKSEVFTTMAFVSNDEDGERDFVFSRGADRELKYDSSLKIKFKDNMVHFGAATALLGGNLEDAYNRYFFDALTQKSFISFDPNYRVDLWKGKEDIFIKKCMPFIQKSNLCKFSLDEAFLISKMDTLEEACQYLHDIGAPIIVITLGGDGTYISMANFKTTVKSIKVDPVDTTGAGDAFIGCLLKQISGLDNWDKLHEKPETLRDMVALANRAGAITTTKYGAINALPTQNQLVS